MLKGIPSILSPALLKILMEMGHGDTLVIGDGNFPAASLAAGSRLTPATALLAAYPLYQLWLCVWIADTGGGVFLRTLAALPVGAATFVAVGALLFLVDRKAGVDERE